MKVHYILFIVWFIVFAFWIVGQFQRSNSEYDKLNRKND